MTRYRSAGDIAPCPRVPRPAAVAQALADGGMLLRHPFSRSAWSAEGSRRLDRARLFVDGRSWPMDRRSAHVLASYEALDEAAVAKLDESGRAALDDLVAQGHFQLRRAPRKRP